MASNRRPVTVTVTVTTALVLLSFIIAVDSVSNNSQVQCSKKCITLNCDNMGIRYGKYCGVGHSGCPGEKPCDELDSCCQIHDDCVEKQGADLEIKLPDCEIS